MISHSRNCTGLSPILAALLAAPFLCTTANAAVTLLGVQYQQDNPYTEYLCLWHDRNYPTSCGADLAGANLHVYLRNDGTSSATINDVTLAGYSLNTVIKLKVFKDHYPYSIYYTWDNPPQDILNAGEPVWFKGDPATIPAGGVAQAVVRLRFVPTTPTVSVGVVTSAGTVNTTIPIEANAPALASVGFSADRTKAYLHWRRSGGANPTTIKMDGNDVTSITTTVGDPNTSFAASVVSLSAPLASMSYHVFQGIYADGKTATASLRTWATPFIYGTWGAFEIADEDYVAAAAWIDTCADRGVNALINQGSGGLTDYLQTSAGRAHAAERNYGFVINYPGKFSCNNPLMWFIDDEPDCEESNLLQNSCGTGLKLPCGSNPNGILGRHFIAQGEVLRSSANSPTTINLDGTNKPSNYYAYGQLADCLMIDSYYQKRLMDSYYYFPNTQPLYAKATAIHATALAGSRAAEPNRQHMLLFSCEANPSCCDPWPFSPPESMRTEVYYALAGGTKGIGYWWMKPGNPSNGLGDQSDPNARALWKEIGLLGDEIKTVQQLIITGHPVNLAVQGSTSVWVRGLASGNDTLILLVVNDNYYNDDHGVHYTPISNATVTVTLPSWISSPSTFDVSAAGIGDVGTQLNGSQLQLSLGTLNVTRMIIVTNDAQLRSTIEQRYEQDVRPGICNFAPDVCNQNVPPSITQHPQSTTICAGISTTIGVGATGTGTLAYQWRKNQANITNGGHYSGVTTSTLTISSADTNDAAQYQCAVSNNYGSATSNNATLTVLACDPNCLHNLGFENGFSAGVGTGWTKFIKAGTEGDNLIFSDEATEKHGGSHSQEIYSHDNAHDGGVYQQFAATPGQNYTLKAWFKVYSPQGTGIAEGLLGIDPTGGTDPNSSNVLWISQPYEYWHLKLWTVTAQGNYITLYLRGRSTKDPGKNKTAYVWIDDIELAPGAPADGTPQAVGTNGIRWRWIDSASETGYRVRDTAGVDKSGLLPADTIQWTETVGLAPNTQYTRFIHAINNCGESDPSAGQSARTLSVPPESNSITPSTSSPSLNEDIIWTATGGFGAGSVQYYRHAWDQNPEHDWTNTETQWSNGTISTSPTAAGTWYLHVQGYNASDIPNGTYDYEITTKVIVVADLDHDGDVDLTDFDLFQSCVSGPAVAVAPNCLDRDFDSDGDADSEDFGILQRCYSGEDNPADPNCAN